MLKQTFGVIVSHRSFFPSYHIQDARKDVAALLTKLGHDYVMVSENDTSLGATVTFEEAKVTAALLAKHKDKISGIIVILPNFGEELGVAEAIQRSGLDVPILIQACEDDFDKLSMAHRRDAFCGKISLCNSLYQRGIPFTQTTMHTCGINSTEFSADVQRFAAICNVVKGLKNSRIAMLGARPRAFNTVRFSEKILQKHGISVQTMDLSEVIAAAEAITDDAAKAKEAEIRAYGSICTSISQEKIAKQARLCLAMEQMVDALDCQASTVQCWDSLEKNYGCAACLGMSMMGQNGKPSACESDVTGAVSMLAAKLATGSAPALMDWNNNITGEADCCISQHCSNFPKSFFQSDNLEIGTLDVLGSVLGEDSTFGACKGVVAPGDMTYIKVSTDDTQGIMKMYVGEGSFEAKAVDTKGGVAYCRVPGLQSLMYYICENGFEHHVCFVRGHVADILVEAMGKYMGVKTYKHIGD